MKSRGPEPVARCIKIAGSQHGVLAAHQALAAGLSPGVVRKLARANHWTRIRPGVFALWVPSCERERWRHRLMATALWLGSSAAVSHRASALDWELEGIGSAPLELSTTGRKRISEAGLVLHRVRSLPADQVVIRGGIKMTSVPRTLIDLCAVADAEAVELALESALRKRLVSVAQVRAALERTGPTNRGRGIMRSLLDGMVERPTESALEVLVWRILVETDLPIPVRQYEVRDPLGRLVARVDFAYPQEKIAVEADGYRFHSGREDWSRDLARQNGLARLGWITYRVTWEDAKKRRRRVVTELTQLLETKRDPTAHRDETSSVNLRY